ncbi:cytochrome-c peroxidase [Spongorhabdus nitratireducens]
MTLGLLAGCQDNGSDSTPAPPLSSFQISGSVSSSRNVNGETLKAVQPASGISVSTTVADDGSFKLTVPKGAVRDLPLELTVEVDDSVYKLVTDSAAMLQQKASQQQASVQSAQAQQADTPAQTATLPVMDVMTTARFALTDTDHNGSLTRDEINKGNEKSTDGDFEARAEELAVAMLVTESNSSTLFYADSYKMMTALQSEEETKTSFFALNSEAVITAQKKLHPEQELMPNPEVTSFLRLGNNAWPVQKQAASFTQMPWACVDDIRRVSSRSYGIRLWQMTDNVQLQTTDAIDTTIQATNDAKLCQQSQWRLPTRTEFEKLFKDGAVRYPKTFPFLSADAGYWVTNDSGVAEVISIKGTPEQDNGRIMLHFFEPVSMWSNLPAVETPVDLKALRESYSKPPAQWPAPTVTEGAEWTELGLRPAVPFPEDNPYSPEKVALGKKLFFDTRLSKDDTVSCASCHDPKKGWADGIRLAVGIKGQTGSRNTPTILNTAYYDTLFLDGRVGSLEEQSLHPISNPIEMGLPHNELLDKLVAVKEYGPLFNSAFGDENVTLERIAQAIATFERTIISQENDFDRFLKGDSNALTDQQLHGLHLFRTKAKCMNCHSGPMMTNNKFENIGLTYYGRSLEDRGRFKVTFNPADMGKFRVPILRDIKATDPGTHLGLFNVANISRSGRVTGMLAMYNNGMTRNRNGSFPQYKYKYEKQFPQVSNLIERLEMTNEELLALNAFMSAVTAEIRQDSATPEEMGI